MSHTFYVIMQKRKDGKVYADLHKTDGRFYLTEEEAELALKHHPEANHFHVVELVAETFEDWDALMKEDYGDKT